MAWKIAIGHIVILQDDSAPRNELKLANVVILYPGADGLVQKLKLTIDEGKPVTRSMYLKGLLVKPHLQLIYADLNIVLIPFEIFFEGN